MRGVDQAPTLVDRRVIEEPFDRASAGPTKAVIHLLHLLGDMDVNGRGPSELDDDRRVRLA